MRLAIVAVAFVAGAMQVNCAGVFGSSAPEAPERARTKAAEEDQDGDSDSVEQTDKTANGTTTTQGMPTECTQQGKLCVPPGDFVSRLCADKFPNVALVMFRRGTPWTRRYVKLPEVEPRNTAGGPSSDTKLVAGEEVILLKRHGGGGGVEVSGATDYDSLRWDGSCASLSDVEMAAHPPGAAKNAPIIWKFLESGMQQALEQDPAIGKARDSWGKACGGKAAGAGKACEQASRNLNNAIVSAVRSGMELPVPERIP